MEGAAEWIRDTVFIGCCLLNDVELTMLLSHNNYNYVHPSMIDIDNYLDER